MRELVENIYTRINKSNLFRATVFAGIAGIGATGPIQYSESLSASAESLSASAVVAPIEPRQHNFNEQGIYADPALAGQVLGQHYFTETGVMYTEPMTIGSNMLEPIYESQADGAPVGSAIMQDTDGNGVANGWRVVISDPTP